ncbi:hypothetical protein [Pontibacter pamirensis]|uniref:hypothetical protein n=1 Tax=Pontibacter pamirensis TaxID=2562824 RepID=UPI001389A966|nr:hypothetical protein [Pontibacter pamirensis]
MSTSRAGKGTDTDSELAERVRRRVMAEGHRHKSKQQNMPAKQRQRREMLLRETLSIASIGSFSYDIETDEMEWTDEMYYIHGYRPGDVALTLRMIISHTHPTDRARVERIVHHALLNREKLFFHNALCAASRGIMLHP